MNEKVAEFLNAETIADWDALVQQLSPGDKQEIARAADQLGQRCARLAEYLEWRGGAGCGDHGHDEANQKAIRHETKIRKAQGYSA